MRFSFLRRLSILVGAGVWFLFLIVVVVNAGVYLSSRSHIFKEITDAPVAETVLIPGAAAGGGELSPIFLDRINLAVRLYEAQQVSKILVSGDNSTLEYNEVNPVRLYLLEKGIPDEDIFLDHAGFDTYSSMYRARGVFGVTSVLIATQSFHLPRAVFIARALGLDAHGVRADRGHVFFRNYVREIFANVKSVLDLVLDRQPKYLGDPIPITGDGRDS